MRTFLDANVLIGAGVGNPALFNAFFALFDDPARTFAASELLRLEVLPKPTKFLQHASLALYQAYFDEVETWAEIDGSLLTRAFELACRYGLGAMDSLHVAAALQTGCEELVTNEKVTKPIYLVQEIRVVKLIVA